VLTYWKYAPRAKRAAALLDGLPASARTGFLNIPVKLLMSISPRACMCHGIEIFNRPIVCVKRGDEENEWRFPLLGDSVEHEE